MSQTLTTRDLFKFWAPLAAMWFMMSIEGTVISVIIARLPDATENLAAFGVAFSLAFFIEAPVIMILSATATLLTDKRSFQVLKNFISALNIVCTLAMIICAYEPVFTFIAGRLMGLPDHMGKLARQAFMMMLPWPAAIGYRRFFQGVLIKRHRTDLVVWGTIARILCMAISAVALFASRSLPGAVVGAIGLASGVTGEAIFTRIVAHKTLTKFLQEDLPTRQISLTYQKLIRFYIPLTLTATMSILTRPVVSFALSRGFFAIESLAILPVLQSLSFSLSAVALAFQETVLVNIGDQYRHLALLKQFRRALLLGLTIIIVFLTLPAVREFVLGHLYGLPAELLDISSSGLLLVIPLPLLAIYGSWIRGILLKEHLSAIMSVATAVESAVVIAVLYFGITFVSQPAIYTGLVALLSGAVAAQIFLYSFVQKILRSQAVVLSS